MQKTIGLSEETYEKVVAVKGSLMMRRKKMVSLPETIEFLLQTKEKVIELLTTHPRNPKKARQLKKCTNLTVAEQYLINAEDWREKAHKEFWNKEAKK